MCFIFLPTYGYISLDYPRAPSCLPVSLSTSPAQSLTIGPVAQGLHVPDCLGRSIGTARAPHVHYSIGNHGLVLLALALLGLFSRGPGGDRLVSSVAVCRQGGSVKPSHPAHQKCVYTEHSTPCRQDNTARQTKCWEKITGENQNGEICVYTNRKTRTRVTEVKLPF